MISTPDTLVLERKRAAEEQTRIAETCCFPSSLLADPPVCSTGRGKTKQNKESLQTENLLHGISGQILAGESARETFQGARWRGQHSLGC